MGFWHCIGDAPVGVPPEEGDYWEPDPGPADGYARLGCAATGYWWGAGPDPPVWLANLVSVSGGVVPGVCELYDVPDREPDLVGRGQAVSAYLTYLPGTLSVAGAYVYAPPLTEMVLRLMDTDYNVLLEAGPAWSGGADDPPGWLELGLNGSLVLDVEVPYWLAVGHTHHIAYDVSFGPASNAPYSAWVATEDYHYCDYVAYPVPDAPEAGRHVLPHLKRTTLGEGTLIPGGASLCR